MASEVRWPLPELGRCERCEHEEPAHIEFKTTPQAIRDLDVWGQPIPRRVPCG
jgi:hypothetical protein